MLSHYTPSKKLSEQAHTTFMKRYSSVLKSQKPSHSARNVWETTQTSLDRQSRQSMKNSNDVNSIHLPKVTRRARKQTLFQQEIQSLRKLLRKLHVQRTAAEHNEVFQILSQFEQFMSLDQPDILKHAVQIAHIEVCSESKQPVLGSTGFYLILKGSVIPHSDPYINLPNTILRQPTPTPTTEVRLTVGDCFGTLKPIEQSSNPNSRMLWILTAEENCEFLKIPADEFQALTRKVQQTAYQEKWNVLRSCTAYKMWPKQQAEELINGLEWLSFPPNTILASEGYRCPFIAFIKVGECHILRKVDVIKTAEDGTKHRQLRQVVMGKIAAPDSFGEISVLLQEAMTCTIVTASPCLTEVTRKLLIHSAKRTYAHFNQDDIRHEYIEQESRKEWSDLKKDIIADIINKKNIQVGKGKWQHSVTPTTSLRVTKSSMSTFV
ncbi:unnamed protein product [Didymodactylos carnosus]|uniref:Cyclic nucleotide-binding domain-containing protein n=1 Tax=Didymodactylos carnosus TaxID=1234261 RepID=A0A813Y193_9BILA|nr:unnamed protein product [Didymodactylos carnosus]CAF3664759.1 unnamed protein product [Didymodactylos carnosus]